MDDFVKLGILFLKAKIPKIIFVDEGMYEKIKTLENEYSKIVLINKTDYELYQYMNHDVLTNFSLNTDNPAKDTIEFMFTMCNKTEWVREATTLNYFNTNRFMWVDFGIRHIFKCNDEEFIEKIEKLNSKAHDGVRIGTIWNLNSKYIFDIYRTISWYFAGGVFGGNAVNLLKFADLMKEKCIDIITKKNTIMWEVNIWYLIWCENPELFDIYACDHDNRIIDNY
jgi:hypothetical protein